MIFTIMIRNIGFTLIELLITMVIISILLAVSYASYRGHIIKVRRNNAVINLNYLAYRLESYYNQNHTYKGASLELLAVDNNDQFYRLTIISTDESSFQVAAVPIGSQAASDKKCETLMLDYLGQKAISGSGKADECF